MSTGNFLLYVKQICNLSRIFFKIPFKKKKYEVGLETTDRSFAYEWMAVELINNEILFGLLKNIRKY